MAENDSNTIKDEETLRKVGALAAIEKVKEILTGLAAIAVLRIQAAGEAEESDLTPHFWKSLYKDSPWVFAGEISQSELPPALEEGLNRMIFKQTSLAWQELCEQAEKVFSREIYDLVAGQSSKEEETAGGE